MVQVPVINSRKKEAVAGAIDDYEVRVPRRARAPGSVFAIRDTPKSKEGLHRFWRAAC